MRFQIEKHMGGDTKEVIKFAWLPVRTSTHWVWLEKYKLTYSWWEAWGNGKWHPVNREVI